MLHVKLIKLQTLGKTGLFRFDEFYHYQIIFVTFITNLERFLYLFLCGDNTDAVICKTHPTLNFLKPQTLNFSQLMNLDPSKRPSTTDFRPTSAVHYIPVIFTFI